MQMCRTILNADLAASHSSSHARLSRYLCRSYTMMRGEMCTVSHANSARSCQETWFFYYKPGAAPTLYCTKWYICGLFALGTCGLCIGNSLMRGKYRPFSARVSQLKIWHFWVTGIERNVCRCTFNRYSFIKQFAKLAAGEQLCRRCTQKIIALQNL